MGVSLCGCDGKKYSSENLDPAVVSFCGTCKQEILPARNVGEANASIVWTVPNMARFTCLQGAMCGGESHRDEPCPVCRGVMVGAI